MKAKAAASRPFTIPNELRGDKSLVAGLEFVDSVHRAGAIAERLLLGGVYDPSTTHLAASIETIGRLDELHALAARLVKAVLVGELTKAQETALRDLEDLFTEVGIAWGEAGYTLGLAMGQRVSMGESREVETARRRAGRQLPASLPHARRRARRFPA
jgi:hypothetical protein